MSETRPANHEQEELRSVEIHLGPHMHLPNEVVVGLDSARAADALHITYDFDRDGYSIKMRPTGDSDSGVGMEELGPPQEVAFIPAWFTPPEDSTTTS